MTRSTSVPTPTSTSVRAAQIWQDLRALILELDDPRRRVVDATGLSFFRTKVLRRLLSGPMSVSEIADALVSDAPYVSLVLRDLEERAFVVRTEDPTDRRRRIIALTDTGSAIAHQALAILESPPPALRALPDRDLATLERIVRQLRG